MISKQGGRILQVDLDRKKCVALVKEAREITFHLKAETEHLGRQIERVLEGGDDELADERMGPGGDQNQAERRPVSKSFWQFWR